MAVLVTTSANPSHEYSLARTANPLNEIVKWVRKDDYVVLHNGENGRFFHRNCAGGVKTEEEIQEFFKTHQVVYIDVSSQAALLNKESATALFEEDIPQCSCTLEKRIADASKPLKSIFITVP